MAQKPKAAVLYSRDFRPNPIQLDTENCKVMDFQPEMSWVAVKILLEI